MEDEIRRILGEHGRLPINVAELASTTDLYAVGLTSHASVNVMLALEDNFGIEFPQTMLRKRTFESIAAIAEAVSSVLSSSASSNLS